MEKDQLKARRKSLGLTQTELATEIGVTQNSVWRWESGTVSPIPKTVELAIEALECRQRDRIVKDQRET